MKATAVTSFAIVGLMYIFQEHSMEMKQSNAVIERYKKQQNILESNLTTSIEKEDFLNNKNIKLLSDFDKINLEHRAKIKELNSAKESIEKNELKYQSLVGELDSAKELIEKNELKYQSLSKEKRDLDNNLTTQMEKITLLKEEKDKVEKKVAKLLTVDKIKTFDSLLSTQESLEANLSNEIEKESLLKDKNKALHSTIDKMLKIAEDATTQATKEHDDDMKEYQGLLSKYKNLEENLSSEIEKENILIEERANLQSKVDKLTFNASELLYISNQSRAKLKDEHKAKIDELKLQLSKELEKEQELEANLTAEIGKENLLIEKSSQLENRLVEQIEEAKEDKQSALSESKSKIEELETELSKEIKEKGSLESNLTSELEQEKLLREKINALESEMSNQISLSKENSQKVKTEHDAEVKRLEDGLAKEIEKEHLLEANLSKEIENEKILIEDKVGLKSKIDELLNTIEIKSQKISTLEGQMADSLTKIEKLTAKRDELEKLTKEREEQLIKEKNATKTALLSVENGKMEIEKILKEIEDKRLAKEKQMAKENKIAKEKLSEAFELTLVEFEINSMKLTEKSEGLLNNTAEVMKRYPNFSYIIQGHTDSRGNEEFNIKLSKNRAEQVKKYLISRGIRADILSTEGIGSAQPIADNESEEGRLLNRRVVFKIVKE